MEVHHILIEKKLTEEAVKELTIPAAHGLVHDMFINSKVSKVEIVNEVTKLIVDYSNESILNCFKEYKEKLDAFFKSADKAKVRVF